MDNAMDIAAIAARTDNYFLKTQQIVRKNGDCRVTYAVFMRSDIIVAANKAIQFLEASYPAEEEIKLEIRRVVAEGTLLGSGSPILYISGSMATLAPLETLFLQRIGFASVSAYNAFAMCRALPRASFIAMDARHCTGDDMHMMGEYGAFVGSETAKRMGCVGFIGSSTAIGASNFGKTSGIGTMPHALIGYAKALSMNSSSMHVKANATLEAAKLYADAFPDEKTLTVLVDFDGSECTDALAVCEWQQSLPSTERKNLTFRLDTHGGRYLEFLDWDQSVKTMLKWNHKQTPAEVFKLATQGFDIDELDGRTSNEIKDKFLFGTGVTAAAVISFRNILDHSGYSNAKIVVSSGFDALKCRIFGNLGVPVDIVGTGSFLPSHLSRTYATADIVRYEFPDGMGGFKNPRDYVKVGREYLKLDV